jgi:PD-(D/E)XK nuclease superfamily protein
VPKTVQPEESFDLYNGRVKLLYRDSSHRYRVSVDGGKPEHCPSVTTILNVLNKPALVEWGVKCACNDIEENLRALFAGNSFTEQQILGIVTRGRTAHDRVREDAAEVGTNVHDWIAAMWRSIITGEPTPPRPTEERERNCVEAAIKWFGEHHLKPLKVEEAQYSMDLGICGRPDWIGWVDDEFAVLDYKSTAKIYPELCLQETFYAVMHNEEFEQLPSVRWGLRLDKRDGSFEARRYKPEMFEDDLDTCKAVLNIYNKLKWLRRKPKEDKKEDFLAEC